MPSHRRHRSLGHRPTRLGRPKKRLAHEEVIFSEPAGAVALADALNAATDGTIDPEATMVCLVTGIGFKDEDAVNQAHFYTIVSRDTVEQEFAHKRQLFLCEQGYTYNIVDGDELTATATPPCKLRIVG